MSVSIEEAFEIQGQQLGAVSLALKLLVSQMHMAGVINGRAVAQNYRLMKSGLPHADEFLQIMADGLCEQIDLAEENGTLTLRPVGD